MKKILAILLAAAITVLLCACGDTTYQGLTDALASGDYEAVKTELSSLSADYKAEQEELSVYEEKYGTLIDALEAEDYELAQEDLQALIPTEPEPEYTYVSISMDNWQEYFDLEQIEYWTVNAFDENEFNGYMLALTVKEAYRDRLPHVETTDRNGEPLSVCYTLDEGINVVYECTYSAYNVTVDTENKTVELGSKKWRGSQDSDTVKADVFDYNGGCSAYIRWHSYNKSESYAYYFDSYEITGIVGKLPLLAE